MKSAAAKWLFLLVLVVPVTFVDQISKQWAHTTLRTQHSGSLAVAHSQVMSVALTYVRNPGAAWGFLATTHSNFRRPFFLIVSGAAIIFIIVLYAGLASSQLLLASALSLIMAGAAGNLIDRLRLSYVVDFIDVRFGSFRWPTFNVADTAISVGVGLLLIEMIIAGRKGTAESAEG